MQQEGLHERIVGSLNIDQYILKKIIKIMVVIFAEHPCTYMSINNIIGYFQEMLLATAREYVSKVCIFIKLIIVLHATNATFKHSFSALR